MEELEKLKKIAEANKDIQEGNEILENYNFHIQKKADDYVNKCQQNIDYAQFIATNKALKGMFGNLSFHQLNPTQQRKVLKMIIDSIEQYLLSLSISSDN